MTDAFVEKPGIKLNRGTANLKLDTTSCQVIDYLSSLSITFSTEKAKNR